MLWSCPEPNDVSFPQNMKQKNYEDVRAIRKARYYHIDLQEDAKRKKKKMVAL